MRVKTLSFSSIRTAVVVAVLAGVTAPPAVGQSVDTTKLAGIQPRAIGPAGMSGRVTAIDVSPTDKDVWYIGTGSGGLWKTSNGANTASPSSGPIRPFSRTVIRFGWGKSSRRARPFSIHWRRVDEPFSDRGTEEGGINWGWGMSLREASASGGGHEIGPTSNHRAHILTDAS